MQVWFSAKAMWDWGSNITTRTAWLSTAGADRVYTNTGWTLFAASASTTASMTQKARPLRHSGCSRLPVGARRFRFYNSSYKAGRRVQTPFSDITQGQPDVVWTVGASRTLTARSVLAGAGGWRRLGLPARAERAQQHCHRRRDLLLQPIRFAGDRRRCTDRRQGGQAVAPKLVACLYRPQRRLARALACGACDDDAMLQVVTAPTWPAVSTRGSRGLLRCAGQPRNGACASERSELSDLAGFGRRFIDVATEDLIADIVYQIGALQGIAAPRIDGVLRQTHGALYNRS